jgi:TatD DNase family protein
MIDSHAHLEFPLYDVDREAVLGRAQSAGVQKIINIGSAEGVKSVHAAKILAEHLDWIYFTTGIHPHGASETNEEDWPVVEQTAAHAKCVAIGETGLDYHYTLAAKDRQQMLFSRHIRLSQTSGLPLVIHCREAFSDVIQMLSGAGLKGVFHCFTGTAKEAEDVLKLGFYISISGIVTFKKNEAFQEVVKNIPLTSLLIETDAPFLSPVPERGKRNEPSFLKHTLKKIADIRGEEVAAVEKATEENTKHLFSI